MCNNPNLDVINISAYTKFGAILSISSRLATVLIVIVFPNMSQSKLNC